MMTCTRCYSQLEVYSCGKRHETTYKLCKLPRSNILEDKQLHIVGYMVELTYDLVISSYHNVFEKSWVQNTSWYLAK